MSTKAESYIQEGLAQGLTLEALSVAIQNLVIAKTTEIGGPPGHDNTVAWMPDSIEDHPPTTVFVHPPADHDNAYPMPDTNRYVHLSLLGRGGMGTVHRVFDRQLRRTLALKLLHRPQQQQPDIAARFLGEAQATAQLQHPGIIPIHDQGLLPDGRLWFTMKEVSGRTLGEVIREVHVVSKGRWNTAASGWTLRRLIDALRRVCEAVAHAHERQVVHRDLKPENIMIGPHGEVLVLDWGLVKIVEEARVDTVSPNAFPIRTDRSLHPGQTTLAGQVAGTPAYMPPEQARGENDQISTRSDVYSLGAILYEILSGRPPYQGSSSSDVLRQVIREAPPPLLPHSPLLPTVGLSEPEGSPTSSGPPLSLALVRACERAMAREATDRFQSADALAHELAAWLDGERKRDEAITLVHRAQACAAQVSVLQGQAEELRERAIEALSDVASWQPEADKAVGWDLEDSATDFDRLAELSDLGEEQLLHASLTHAPDLPEAHAALASRYRAAHRAAEAARRDTVRAEILLRQHLSALPEAHPERLSHEAYLNGAGALSIVTDPPGAEVILHRYTKENRRLVPTFERKLGTTPIHAVRLPMGSYLCVIRHPERAEVRYPVFIERQQHWDGRPPEGGAPTPVRLPHPDELGPDDCYVPCGWFWSGETPSTAHLLPSRRRWLDAHVFRRFPVTNAEYLVFLDSLVAKGQTEAALRHAPRERGGTVGELGPMIYGFDGTHFSLRPDADGDVWEPDVPVFMVDWDGASAFAAWEAERTGEPWRLPCELAWEKAARGVDGRFYPWGDRFDPSWACMRDSHPGRILPASVHDHPLDESPYGIRGMAGNASDWCIDGHKGSPTSQQPARVPLPDVPPPPATARQTRGGGWYSEATHLRAADRYWNDPTSRTISLGFRLARHFRSFPD